MRGRSTNFSHDGSLSGSQPERAAQPVAGPDAGEPAYDAAAHAPEREPVRPQKRRHPSAERAARQYAQPDQGLHSKAQKCLTMASPNSEHFTSFTPFSPSAIIRRAKS